MKADELYQEIKDALRYFGLGFYEMNKMTVHFHDKSIAFSYEDKTLVINEPEGEIINE